MLWLLQLSVAPKLRAEFADALSGMDIVLFSAPTVAALIAAGFILGTFGSAIAVRRFLDQEAS